MKDWNEFYEGKFSVKDFIDNLHTHTELFEEIVRSSSKKILEIGIGTGTMGIFLSWLGYNVTGADNDSEILKRAQDLSNRMQGKVRYVSADAFELDATFKENEFDVVFSQGLFEHFDNSQIIVILKKQLKISKEVIISVPSRYYFIRDFGNERLMGIEGWAKILSDFNISTLKYYGTYIPSRAGLLHAIMKPSSIVKFLLGTVIKSRAHILINIKK